MSRDSERMAPVAQKARRLGRDLQSLIENRKPGAMSVLLAEVRDFLLEEAGGEAGKRCYCARCERDRFAELHNEIVALRNKESEGLDEDKLEAAELKVAEKLHAEVVLRHPYGPAVQLYRAITSLCGGEYVEADDYLYELYTDERNSIELNEDDEIEPCKLGLGKET